MKQALADLMQRLLSDAGLTLEDFVWGTLFLCLICSTTHLVSMLVTRWGDRGASAKALIFSILLHLSCVMGVAGMSLKTPATLDEGEQAVVPVRNVILDEENESRQPSAAESESPPLWDQLTPPEPSNVRAEAVPQELKPAEMPERQDVAVERIAPTLPDFPMKPSTQGEAPEAAKPPQPEPVTTARPDVAMPSEPPRAAESRPDVVPAAPTVSRAAPARSDGIETPAMVKPAPGAVERVVKEPEPQNLVSSIAARPDPESSLPRAVPQGDVVRRTGPAPSTVEIESAGTTATETTAPTENVATGGTGIRRKVSRSEGTESATASRSENIPVDASPTRSREPRIRDSLASTTGRDNSVPSLTRPDADPLSMRGNAGIPATYRLRSLAGRRDVARKFGGTDASEKAVENALKWFISVQEPDGSWDGDRFGSGQVKVDEKGVDREYAGRDSDTGLTALVILSFLGAGYTHEEGEYALQVEKALKWLVAQQREDGYLGGKATHYAQMYCHGIATYALAEACGMQNDPAADTGLREPLKRAVRYILANQNPTDGGWRYVKGQKSDMSIFGWQLMALKSAEIAGLRIPEDARAKMVQFLKDRSLGTNKGLAGYREGSPASLSMTAEALFCKQMLGISRTNPQAREASEYLLNRLPRRTDMDEYYWYYGTLAMYQMGGTGWEQWNSALRDLLLADQVASGVDAGSWEARGLWGRYGGRLYQTALSTLCLEVYYRFLPLYQFGDPVE